MTTEVTTRVLTIGGIAKNEFLRRQGAYSAGTPTPKLGWWNGSRDGREDQKSPAKGQACYDDSELLCDIDHDVSSEEECHSENWTSEQGGGGGGGGGGLGCCPA